MSELIKMLLDEKLISRSQLNDAKTKQLGAKKPLQDILIEMGFIKEEELLGLTARRFGLPLIKLEDIEADPAVVKLVPYDTAKSYGVFPLRKENNTLLLAMSDPFDVIALDDIKLLTKLEIKPVLATKSQISGYIENHYYLDDITYDILKNAAMTADVEILKDEEEPVKQLIDIEALKNESAPVVKLVNLIMIDAVKNRATDIHIEPQDKSVEVRYRIDGELKTIMRIHKSLHLKVIARIKILSNLDIAETRKSQDGRFSILFDHRKIDLRVSMIPVYHGEKAALRILDPQTERNNLLKLGLEQNELDMLVDSIRRPNGMVLVTGPTGCGKTTTLYAALNFIKSEAKNIVTIEDPIEYLVPGINQTQVNLAKEVTFANALRTILRQDPNVILVGEIRDRETADIAFRASLTGHLVFSTLHTNSAAATITRLLDIGLEPYLIASSVVVIIAQRLIRLICPQCREEYAPAAAIISQFQPYLDRHNIKKFYHGKGCHYCNFTGYFGRTAIFEIMRMGEGIRSLISGNAPQDAILREARDAGLKTLVESGIEKVCAGITTLEEVATVVYVEKESTAPKILLVDDEEDVLEALEKQLTVSGYRVLKARNGEESVAQAIRERPDLIIMDIFMPVMNGFEATRLLRQRLTTAVIPVMMLTASALKENELKGFDAGADDYITKPFDYDKLLARIKMLLKRNHHYV